MIKASRYLHCSVLVLRHPRYRPSGSRSPAASSATGGFPAICLVRSVLPVMLRLCQNSRMFHADVAHLRARISTLESELRQERLASRQLQAKHNRVVQQLDTSRAELQHVKRELDVASRKLRLLQVRLLCGTDLCISFVQGSRLSTTSTSTGRASTGVPPARPTARPFSRPASRPSSRSSSRAPSPSPRPRSNSVERATLSKPCTSRWGTTNVLTGSAGKSSVSRVGRSPANSRSQSPAPSPRGLSYAPSAYASTSRDRLVPRREPEYSRRLSTDSGAGSGRSHRSASSCNHIRPKFRRGNVSLCSLRFPVSAIFPHEPVHAHIQRRLVSQMAGAAGLRI